VSPLPISISPVEAEGHSLMFGGVSGDSVDAMGLHYENWGFAEIRHHRPHPSPDCDLRANETRTTKADRRRFPRFVDQWNKNPKHTAPPELMGRLIHLFDAPNRFGLPAFYTLHVWACMALTALASAAIFLSLAVRATLE